MANARSVSALSSGTGAASFTCASMLRASVARASTFARRARMTSTCAAAILPAMSTRSGPAFGPAMARAKSAISCASAGSSPAGRLRPWRSALRAERALPSGVFGPQLRRPFLRLASRRASLIIPRPACSCFVLTRVADRGKQNFAGGLS
jgi:hypothetical protein